MNRDQLRAMHLAGTVAVPQKFPELAIISFTVCPTGDSEATNRREFLCADHVLNPKLRIRRWFYTRQVCAVFLPHDPACVSLQQGDWFIAGEVFAALPTALENRGPETQGIVYVPEQASTLMQVEVGMTAAESVEYYPPLPDDRTADHYQLGQPSRAQRVPYPQHDDPCSWQEGDPCSWQRGDPCSWFSRESDPPSPQQHGDPCSWRMW